MIVDVSKHSPRYPDPETEFVGISDASDAETGMRSAGKSLLAKSESGRGAEIEADVWLCGCV